MSMVFISTAMVQSEARKSVTNPILQKNDHSAIDHDKRNASGEPMSADCFPTEAWSQRETRKPDYSDLANFFYAGGFWFVSAKAAAVLNQHDLGAGALYPVAVYGRDRATPISEGWYCLNVGNRKTAFLAAESTRVRPQVGGRWPTFATLKDDEFAVSADALAGPDLWVDPLLWDSIFFSERLGTALTKAKAAKGFYLRTCRVID